MKKFLTITTLTLLVLLLFVPSYSQGMKIKTKNCEVIKSKVFADNNFEMLNLTDDQKDKIDDLQAQQHKSMIEYRYKLSLKHFELAELMRKSPDEKKALKLVEEINNIKLDIEKSRISNHFKIRAILNDEQKKIFDKNFGFGFGGFKSYNVKGRGEKIMLRENCPFNDDDED
uniref:Periplasmic heavy metal sensor n=1 Tax=candidate division WOR-3 bacterium TaxID=2052148 RepID=A0A7C3J6T2_UNCW3